MAAPCFPCMRILPGQSALLTVGSNIFLLRNSQVPLGVCFSRSAMRIHPTYGSGYWIVMEITVNKEINCNHCRNNELCPYPTREYIRIYTGWVSQIPSGANLGLVHNMQTKLKLPNGFSLIAEEGFWDKTPHPYNYFHSKNQGILLCDVWRVVTDSPFIFCSYSTPFISFFFIYI